MERGLVVPSWTREAAAFGGAAESSPPSWSSSGCQSGWTLYLDHSNGGVRCLPCDTAAAAQRWVVLQAAGHAEDEEEEDSMASDASSGPRPRLRDDEDSVFEQHPGSGRHSCYSSSATAHHSASGSGSGSGSGCFGSSTRSRGSQGEVHAAGRVPTRAAVVVHGAEAATRHYREIIVVDDNDELDDTASSSVVFSGPRPVAMVHVNFSS